MTSIWSASPRHTDADYDALCPPTRYESQRLFVETLWQEYEPLADRHFRTQIANSFHQRYWEMYLACTLLDQGLPVQSADAGPDICVDQGSRKVWIEATAPTGGNNPDAVPEKELNVSADRIAQRVPNREVTLRLCTAIDAKFKKYRNYVANGTIEQDSPYIIAINANGVPFAAQEPNVPRIISAVLPIGDEYVVINRNTLECMESGFQYRPTIPRSGAPSIPATLFQDREFAGISAVWYSITNVWSFDLQLGQIAYVVRNPLAANPIPHGWLRLGREYWIEHDELRYHDWTDA